MGEMEIRLAELGDSKGVVETVMEVYHEFGFTWDEAGYHADLYDLGPYVRDDEVRFWVAISDGEVVGCGGVEFFPLIGGEADLVEREGMVRIAGTAGEIIRMYVRPAGRRQGVAGAIMRLIVEGARARNTPALEIWSDKRFVDAHRLYERNGAVKVGERTCDDPDLAPEWGFRLTL